MALQFCPVCRALLQIKEENGNNIAFCNCGFIRKSGVDLSSTDKGKNKFRGEGVASSESNSFGVDYVCKKCRYNKAELIDLGERNTNESGVYIYKCLKCGHSERKSGICS